ncbi:helicase-related protein, partial [Streptomyces sp. P17]|uniref:DEAD/DEAH box helicase n=1 Tax=Streptomyces sp. P17 TaxID=3074716 RepID=UPI0028F4250E
KAAAEKSRSVGDVVREYSRHALGKRAICFATDVDTANKIAKQFNDAGIRAASVSAKTPSPVREKYIKEFKAGVVKILVNVDLFDEGFDVPACEVVIMA